MSSPHCEGRKSRDLHQVGEHNHILKLARQPNQIQRILINADLVRQTRRIVAAEPGSAIGVDADAEESHARLELRPADDLGDCGVNAEVCLCC